jgi:hypothetical protein
VKAEDAKRLKVGDRVVWMGVVVPVTKGTVTGVSKEDVIVRWHDGEVVYRFDRGAITWLQKA